MIEAIFDGLLLFTWKTTAFVFLGIACGTIVGIIPGLGGMFILALMLPFTYGMEPTTAIAMMLAALAVIGTSNTVTSVLFGVPGNVSGVASVFDGYPLAKKGEAARALGAGFTASAVGGLIGALCLALVLPFVRPLILLFGPSEFFALVVVALVMMSYIGTADTLKALVSGGAGLMLSFVGMEMASGTLRYTFGQLYLWDGLPIIPAVIGLFAIAEMMLLLRKGEAIASSDMSQEGGGTLRGMLDVFRNFRTTLMSSIIGVIVGLMPGLGGETAQYLAYSQAARMSKNRDNFGKGEIEGVIAADAATNSKDGGTLIPTLLFGIPGSAPTALLLSAFIMFGIQPGRSMLDEHLDFTWFLIWVLIFSGLSASILCLSFSGLLARLTYIRPNLIVAPVLVVALFGAYATNKHVGDLLVALSFGVLGYYMEKFGYSRATLVIALVLGPLLERNFLLAMQIYGGSFIFRPIVLGLLIVSLLVVVGSGPYRKFFAGIQRSVLK